MREQPGRRHRPQDDAGQPAHGRKPCHGVSRVRRLTHHLRVLPRPGLASIATFLFVAFLACAHAFVQVPGTIVGRVLDETGGVLAGVTVHVRALGTEVEGVTDETGRYRLSGVRAGRAEVEFRLVNFTALRRTLDIMDGCEVVADAVMRLAL